MNAELLFIYFLNFILTTSLYLKLHMNNTLNLGLNIEEPESRTIKLSTFKNARDKIKTNTMYKNLPEDKKSSMEDVFDNPKSNIIDLARIFASIHHKIHNDVINVLILI